MVQIPRDDIHIVTSDLSGGSATAEKERKKGEFGAGFSILAQTTSRCRGSTHTRASTPESSTHS
jgi:hypothetical protein